MFKIMNEVKEEITLSHEMIDVQKNDYVVPAIKNIYKQIIKRVKELGFNNSARYFKDKGIQKLYKELDTTISKRFGINYKHISTSNYGYAIFTAVPMDTYNVLKYDTKTIYNNSKNYLDGQKGLKENNDDILSYEEDYLSVQKKINKSLEELNDKLYNGGILVDLHKATIQNLPKDYSVFVLVDLRLFVDELNFNEDMLTGLLLHEIGHSFTHIENSYRTLNTTINISETIQENLLDKNKSPKDTLKLIYVDVLKGDKKDVDNENITTILLKSINKYTSSLVEYNTNNYHDMTDSEMLADQFAGRFGLGLEVVEALDKWNKAYPVEKSTISFLDDADLFPVVYTGYMLFFFTLMSGFPALMAITITAVGSLMMKIVMSVNKVDSSSATTYDNDYRRFKRIRNEMVKQLRTSIDDKKLVKQLLDRLDKVDKLLTDYKEEAYSPSFTEKIYMRLAPGKVNASLEKYLEEVVEDLLNNELHVASLKLKNL